ncbi:MAG TPA: DUF992 domain-containing protein [Beijerinckiaceae bacterium]
MSRISSATPLALAAAVAGLCAVASPAAAQTRVGVLECNVSGGVGFVITSEKALACAFRPAGPAPVEYYVGTIRRFGLDVGVTGPGALTWAVFAPSDYVRGALAGGYVGATASATVGAGVGANALIGGSDRTISLQPLSVNVQTGVNLAAGVGEVYLEPAAPPPRPRR